MGSSRGKKKINIHKIKNIKLKEEKTKKRNQIILGIVIATLMALSVLSVTTTTRKHYYKGHKIYIDDYGNPYIMINGNKIMFNYLPDELENLNLSRIDLTPTLIFTFDNSFDSYDLQTLDAIRLDIANTLTGYDDIIVMFGIANETLSQNYSALPLITCDNASSLYTIIYLTKGDFNITKQNNCIKVRYNRNEDIIALRDKIIYIMLGILD